MVFYILFTKFLYLATFIAYWNWRTEIENFYQAYKRKLPFYIGQSGISFPINSFCRLASAHDAYFLLIPLWHLRK